jgi:hypothetical protein
MICEFQKKHALDYTDRRKAMYEKNVTTVLENTADDIQEARDDNGGDDARVREDLELRWVTNLSEERKRFYLIATLLDPRTKVLSFCDNQYFSSKDEGHVKFLHGGYSRRSQS